MYLFPSSNASYHLAGLVSLRAGKGDESDFQTFLTMTHKKKDIFIETHMQYIHKEN